MRTDARRNDAIIVEDDYDGEFVFGARPLDALQMLDSDARVLYVGTFSKSLFPSLRKGFIVVPPWARDALIAVKHSTDAHSDALVQAVLAEFIFDGHLARHVRRMRSIYAARRTALLRGIGRHLSEWLDPIPSEVGLHLAARIRDRRLAPRVFVCAAEHLPEDVADGLLAEYLPYIKPGGRVVFITPQERGYATDATHVWFVGHDETKRLAGRAGLTVERQYSFPFPRRAGRIFAYNEFVMVGRVPDTQ